MQRLSGLDAAFLNLETEAAPMHIAGLLILDASAAPRFGFTAVREVIGSRLHLLPAFRRRLVVPPLNLIQPFWIEDPDFELGRHVRRIVLPAPGGDAELAAKVAELIETRLDRSRPLWEFYYIEGLASGHIACLSKVHHACIDGISGVELLAKVLDTAADAPPPASPSRVWRPEDRPSLLRLGWLTARGLWRVPRELRRLLRETVEVLEAEPEAAPPPPELTPAPVARELAPRTRFNVVINAQRAYAFGALSNDLIRKVKRAFGVTANDVILCVVAEALRRYLLEHHELPDRSMYAVIPMSVRQRGEYGAGGNRLIFMRTHLGTDIADPLERMRGINARMKQLKSAQQRLPTRLVMDWINLPAPALLAQAARLYERYSLQDYVHLPFNLIVSNVPGPRDALYLAGAKLLAHYPVSIPYHGVAFNITLFNYGSQVDVGLTAHRGTMPDVDRFMHLMRTALEDLHARAQVSA